MSERMIEKTRFAFDRQYRPRCVVLVPTIQISAPDHRKAFWHVSVVFLFWSYSVLWSKNLTVVFLSRKKIRWFPITWKLLILDPRYWVKIWFARWRYFFVGPASDIEYYNRLQNYLITEAQFAREMEGR